MQHNNGQIKKADSRGVGWSKRGKVFGALKDKM